MTVVPADQAASSDRVQRITDRARAIRPGRSVLTALAAVLFALGWVVAKASGVVWLALTWSAAAVQIGWEEARTSLRTPADGGA